MLIVPLLLLFAGSNPLAEASEPLLAAEPRSTSFSKSALSGGFLSLRKGRMTLVSDAGVEQIYGESGDHQMAWRGHLELGALSEAELRWSGRGSLRAYGPASIEWSGSPFTGKPLGLFDFARVELEVRLGELGVRLPGGVLLVAKRSAFEVVQRSSGMFGVHHLGGEQARLIVPAEGAPEVRELVSGDWIWIDPADYLFQSRFEYSLVVEPEPEPVPVAVEPEPLAELILEPEPIIVYAVDPFVLEPEHIEAAEETGSEQVLEVEAPTEPEPEPEPVVELDARPAAPFVIEPFRIETTEWVATASNEPVPVSVEQGDQPEQGLVEPVPSWRPVVEFRTVAPLLQFPSPPEESPAPESVPAPLERPRVTPPESGTFVAPAYRWRTPQWLEAPPEAKPAPAQADAPASAERRGQPEEPLKIPFVGPQRRGGLSDLFNGLKPF